MGKVWTDADIDAAYIMGLINSEAVQADKDAIFPILSKVKNELKRLRGIGFKNPSDALRSIRYPANTNINPN